VEAQAGPGVRAALAGRTEDASGNYVFVPPADFVVPFPQVVTYGAGEGEVLKLASSTDVLDPARQPDFQTVGKHSVAEVLKALVVGSEAWPVQFVAAQSEKRRREGPAAEAAAAAPA